MLDTGGESIVEGLTHCGFALLPDGVRDCVKMSKIKALARHELDVLVALVTFDFRKVDEVHVVLEVGDCSVGSGEKLKDGSLRTLDVQEGDKVVYSYSTTEISIDGKNYLLMKESNILGVLPA